MPSTRTLRTRGLKLRTGKKHRIVVKAATPASRACP